MLPRLLLSIAGSIAAVINAPAYKHATWGLLVVDAKSGRTLYARNAEQMFVPGSTKKLLSAAAALEVFGPDYRFVTPVYRRGDDLILRAVGDPNLTGRVTEDGHLALTDVDHTNANAVPDAVAVDVDPLIGLDDLAPLDESQDFASHGEVLGRLCELFVSAY